MRFMLAFELRLMVSATLCRIGLHHMRSYCGDPAKFKCYRLGCSHRIDLEHQYWRPNRNTNKPCQSRPNEDLWRPGSSAFWLDPRLFDRAPLLPSGKHDWVWMYLVDEVAQGDPDEELDHEDGPVPVWSCPITVCTWRCLPYSHPAYSHCNDACGKGLVALGIAGDAYADHRDPRTF